MTKTVIKNVRLLNPAQDALVVNTHFLDLPLLVIIIALGTIKPDSWTAFFIGCVMSLLIPPALTVSAPKLYPWRPQNS